MPMQKPLGVKRNEGWVWKHEGVAERLRLRRGRGCRRGGLGFCQIATFLQDRHTLIGTRHNGLSRHQLSAREVGRVFCPDVVVRLVRQLLPRHVVGDMPCRSLCRGAIQATGADHFAEFVDPWIGGVLLRTDDGVVEPLRWSLFAMFEANHIDGDFGDCGDWNGEDSLSAALTSLLTTLLTTTAATSRLILAALTAALLATLLAATLLPKLSQHLNAHKRFGHLDRQRGIGLILDEQMPFELALRDESHGDFFIVHGFEETGLWQSRIVLQVLHYDRLADFFRRLGSLLCRDQRARHRSETDWNQLKTSQQHG